MVSLAKSNVITTGEPSVPLNSEGGFHDNESYKEENVIRVYYVWTKNTKK